MQTGRARCQIFRGADGGKRERGDRFEPIHALHLRGERKRLRCGYTTGTCAAAAARGAAELLLRGTYLPAVRIDTPAGIPVDAELEAFSAGPGWASCAVRKDGGDDPDITDGALIFAGRRSFRTGCGHRRWPRGSAG